jgi:engulfment/cell motility protein 1
VTKLTESQVAYVLGGGGEKTWFKVRQEFNAADYRSVRDRWNRELEMEDDIGSKASVRYALISLAPSSALPR